jgi:hypothetical protein
MNPVRADNARALSFLAVILLTGIVLVIARNMSSRVATAAVVATLVAGTTPGVIEMWLRSERAVQRDSKARVERAAYDARALAQIESRTQDIEARIAERRPYQGEEARLFVVFVIDVDNTTANGKDHSPQSIALMQRALEAKILDPNTIVKQPVRADRGPEPLFLNFYRNVRQRPDQSLLGRDWKILKLLAAHGADITLPEAALFAGDLRKTETPLYGGLYVELK